MKRPERVGTSLPAAGGRVKGKRSGCCDRRTRKAHRRRRGHRASQTDAVIAHRQQDAHRAPQQDAWAAISKRGKLNSRFFFPFFMCQIPSFTVCAQCADLTRMCKWKHFYTFSVNNCFSWISVTIQIHIFTKR